MKSLIKKILIYASILLMLIILSFVYLLLFHTYKEENITPDKNKYQFVDLSNPDINGNGINNIDEIVINARKLKGVFYDYFQGKYNNIGKNLGFLVCVDIPRISYQQAGIYFEPMLREDFKIHPEYYNTEDGINTPSSEFFSRRVRNLYSYCEANNKLIKNCKTPMPGDFVFYGKNHIALVVEVHNDGTYNEIENAPWTIWTVEHVNKIWNNNDVGRLIPQ